MTFIKTCTHIRQADSQDEAGVQKGTERSHCSYVYTYAIHIHIIYIYVYDIYMQVGRRGRSRCTGWQRCIGCLKLQVIFRKRATNFEALLRKMICKEKAFYASSPPCTEVHRTIASLVCRYIRNVYIYKKCIYACDLYTNI